ncbi:NAD(P)H-hydrate dehydratase [Anaerophaga thermohalophila]|uniref:NAD(P)H-hydrate dehydratase n=1 Tax=Anaerophaga thermohalophila TaxID=177400 RepID=UPI000237CA45|nr:NAD(P)H-hydrate dehydratase [Anaerophaga thermohalophila]
MKILTSKQTGEVDRFTIENEPIASIHLMERAATQAYRWISDKYPAAGFSIFAGPGNNGGDALAIARMLISEGRNVDIFLIRSERLSPDAATNLERLRKISSAKITDLSTKPLPNSTNPGTVAIDGLFGSGLNRPLNEKASSIVSFINKNYDQKVSVDVPSGLFCEDNGANIRENIVKATYTLTFQLPKLSFLFAENKAQVGQWIVLPIGLSNKKIEETLSPWHITESWEVKNMLPPPNRFAHKGTMGHALLIAGSYGKTGAALIASMACLKSGVGLLTTHVPHSAVSILQTAIPEAMMSVDRSDLIFTEFPDLSPFPAIGIGPGIGTKINSQRAFRELLSAAQNKKMVIDADGLNILAANKEYLNYLQPGTILTPHPKEFERLAGLSENDYQRLEKGIEFAKEFNIVLVLKGAYTAVISPRGEVRFNPTGNPGMATAGSGDALTGIILALLANGIEPFNAARVGVYVHGLAGDLAAQEGQRGTIATKIIENLGPAFAKTTEI